MGRLYLEYLEGNNIYSCGTCGVHLTSYNELISKVSFFNIIFKAFRGRSGKAYLFNNVYLFKNLSKC